nr:AlNc14C457G11778 [Albugo laibachii Nc14]|eukprot:CCA27122.1 AlNc14C457G11778 [Albugo laibachii Nc14]
MRRGLFRFLHLLLRSFYIVFGIQKNGNQPLKYEKKERTLERMMEQTKDATVHSLWQAVQVRKGPEKKKENSSSRKASHREWFFAPSFCYLCYW